MEQDIDQRCLGFAKTEKKHILILTDRFFFIHNYIKAMDKTVKSKVDIIFIRPRISIKSVTRIVLKVKMEGRVQISVDSGEGMNPRSFKVD